MSANELIKKAPTLDNFETVCGIDALYFYIKIDLEDYKKFFLNLQSIEGDNYKLLSPNYEKQFTYFEHYGLLKGFKDLEKICRIGFKNTNTNDFNDFIIVQMETIILQQMTLDEIKEYFTEQMQLLGLCPLKFQLSRFDLNTYVFNFDLSWINYNYFSTRMKENRPFNNQNIMRSFYIGSSSGIQFKIYNKLEELKTLDFKEGLLKQALIEKKYIYKYFKSPIYDNLWNMEYKIKREQMKSYGIDTIDDLKDKANGLFITLGSNVIRLLEEEKKDFHNDRINNHRLWDTILSEYDYNGSSKTVLDRETKARYYHNETWLNNRLTEFLNEPFNNDPEILQRVEELQRLINLKNRA